MIITQTILQECYFDATKNNGLIDLTKNLSNPQYELKIHDIKMIFKNSPLWHRCKQKTGHCKFTHAVTKIVVEFQGHSSKKDTTVKPGILDQILYNVHRHLNILGNDIFKYKKHNWKKEPNYYNTLETLAQQEPDYTCVLRTFTKKEPEYTSASRPLTKRHLVI